jgi:hypothetical protein
MITQPVNWQNPYSAKGRFKLKGNLHTHTQISPCGRVPPGAVVRHYQKTGYDFLSITDHNAVTEIQSAKKDPVLFPGIEIDFNGGRHTCVIQQEGRDIYHASSAGQQDIISRNAKKGGIVILNHPDWQIEEHYPLSLLLRLRDYSGIEIYNSVIERLQGSPLSTAKWDRLLEKGRKVLGFANQDYHWKNDMSDCCNVVWARGKTPRAIFSALKSGCFYCHYGVDITDIGRNKDSVYVATRNSRIIRFIGGGGRIYKKVKAKNASFSFKDCPDSRYLRVECLGTGEEISWTQPFFH